jgi:hypothetical protein
MHSAPVRRPLTHFHPTRFARTAPTTMHQLMAVIGPHAQMQGHLSACTAETHVSSITEDSILAPNLHLSGIPTWESGDVTPHLATGRPPSAVRIDCATVGYETQLRPPVTGCQFQSSYSNNNDNPVTHRLSAVSNIAAAGPGGESGSHGHLPVCESPSADGGVGSRARPDIPLTRIDVTPTSTPSSGTCGKPPADTDPEVSECMGPRGSTPTMAAPNSSGRYGDDVVTGGGLASGDSHRYRDDRSGPVPGHASPRQADNSGYAYAPTINYVPGAEQFPDTTVPGSTPR